MAEEADYIQGELYRDSNFLHDRNTKILYYDCTNYYFETEEESGGRKYGKSKEHRPNPIVTMGTFHGMQTVCLSLLISILETRTNSSPSSLLKTR